MSPDGIVILDKYLSIRSLDPLLDSGAILTTIVAVLLNAYYIGIGVGATEAVEGQLAKAVGAADP